MQSVKLIGRIAVLVAAISLAVAPSASAKLIHDGSFVTVWQGNSVVTCKNTYSIRYRFYLLACRNPRNQLAIVGTSYVKVTTDDGSFAFPDQATAMYPGDYWRSGRLQCRVFGYGRVRCYSLTSSTQGFEIARSYAIPMTFS